MSGTPVKLLRPLMVITLSSVYLPITLWRLISTFQFDRVSSWPKFQHSWFSEFWKFFGPKSREMGRPAVEPLLRSAYGVVLDIGPGSGQWVDLFSASQNRNGAITKIYGVEPNPGQHPALRAAVKKAGLEDTYEILGVGVEDLQSLGIAPGSIDTIATIQVMCSVPAPERIIKDLYPLLKPGGQWLVYEHVKTKYTDDFVATWQNLLQHVWPHFCGGCCINRPTDVWLLQAGEWESAKLQPGQGEDKYDSIPHAIGTLVKKL